MACRMEQTWNGAGRLPGPAGRVAKSSVVLVFGVAVKATKVIPLSPARVAICAARMSSVLTSPPSFSSAIYSGLSKAFSFDAASPVGGQWASSAITAKRLAFVTAS